ncbi:MAG: undecaprenyl-diphosphate phosphatase [Acidobacteriota bacterium]
MTWGLAVLLAVVQGLTEFLPVSSSGHLALLQNGVQRATGATLPGALALDVLLHVGTLAAVVVYFRHDLVRLAAAALGEGTTPGSLTGPASAADNGRRELALMAVALLPTAVIGLALHNVVDQLLQRPRLVSGCIGATGLLLLLARPRGAPGRAGAHLPGWRQALLIGTAQGLAVLPGLSRSGLTIATGLLVGLAPMAAFRWSFLLSIPVIAGAALLELLRPGADLSSLGWPAAGATLLAAAVGLVSLRLLARSVARIHFHRFGWYCLTMAGLGLLLFTVWTA